VDAAPANGSATLLREWCFQGRGTVIARVFNGGRKVIWDWIHCATRDREWREGHGGSLTQPVHNRAGDCL